MNQDNKTTHEIKLFMFNDYDMYKNIVHQLRNTPKISRIEVIKIYAKMCFDFIQSKTEDPLMYDLNEVNHKYLLSCFSEDLK